MQKHIKYLKDFVSNEHREFPYKVGKIVASSLSGFIAGVVFASIFWLVSIIFLLKK